MFCWEVVKSQKLTYFLAEASSPNKARNKRQPVWMKSEKDTKTRNILKNAESVGLKKSVVCLFDLKALVKKHWKMSVACLFDLNEFIKEINGRRKF